MIDIWFIARCVHVYWILMAKTACSCSVYSVGVVWIGDTALVPAGMRVYLYPLA